MIDRECCFCCLGPDRLPPAAQLAATLSKKSLMTKKNQTNQADGLHDGFREFGWIY